MKISDILLELANNWAYYSALSSDDPDLIAAMVAARKEQDSDQPKTDSAE